MIAIFIISLIIGTGIGMIAYSSTPDAKNTPKDWPPKKPQYVIKNIIQYEVPSELDFFISKLSVIKYKPEQVIIEQKKYVYKDNEYDEFEYDII